jgi:hypothetical protein
MSNFNNNFNWQKYFDLSLELAGIDSVEEIYNITGDRKPRSEAKLRASISRAYYAAHCIARNYLRDKLGHSKLKSRRGFNQHQYVIETLESHLDNDLVILGKELFDLRIRRNDADYMDKKFENIRQDTEMSIIDANHIITTIRERSS